MTDLSNELPEQQMPNVDSAVLATQEEIARLLKSAPTVIRPMTRHLSKAAGKMIRARALLICAERRDGTINPDAVKVSAAIELLHTATLVHDDMIDNASKRRGIEALHNKFGGKFAVLCGDYLFCMALQLAADVRILENRKDMFDKTLTRYLIDVCLGEVRQNQNNHNYRLSEREYFEIIKGKTAALFEASFYAGFLFSDEPETAKEAYIEIGNKIGLIFQLADDCSDYESTQKQAKKPVMSDFDQGVVTLPLIYAMKKDKQLRGRLTDGISLKDLRAAVKSAGGLTYTHTKITSYAEKTKALIDALENRVEKKRLMTALLVKAAGETV